MTTLDGWQTFYEIVGSSAGALIGLQFVVMALVADMPRTPAMAEAGHAFATPTIVHFGTVLLLAGTITAPWPHAHTAAAFWGLIGAVGVVYSITITRRMRRQNAYKPVFEDWLFHCLLPLAAHATLVTSALIFSSSTYPISLFAVAAATLALLFTGIHNAWDGATYHVFVKKVSKE